MRMLFSKDTEEIIGDGGRVLGEFNLSGVTTMNDDSTIITVCAADMDKADDFYGLRFRDYGKITEEHLNTSIIISAKTADEYNLGVGDTFTFNMLNRKFDFTVVAIALNGGVFDNVVGIINIGAISEALASANPAIASLGDAITPYTSLRIKINDKSQVDEYIARLSSDERLAGHLIINEEDNVANSAFFRLTYTSITIVSAFIVILLSALVISTALDLLSKKRRMDTALFMICGADTKDLHRIVYLECLIYSAIAVVIGLTIYVPILYEINNVFDWKVSDIAPQPYDVLIAILGAPAIILATACIKNAKAKKETISELLTDQNTSRIDGASLKSCKIWAIILAAFVCITLMMPTDKRFSTGLCSIVAFIAIIYLLIPHIIKLISKGLICLIEKARSIPPKAFLVIKNISASYPLMHTARLITVLFTILYMVVACLNVFYSQIHEIDTLMDCDYVAINENQNIDDDIRQLDEVDYTYRLNLIQNLVTEKNTGMMAFSASEDAKDYLNPNISPKKIPVGNEIAISKGLSKLLKKSVGDELVLMYETKEYRFKVIEIIKTNANFVFLDVSHLGVEKNLLCIKSNVPSDSEGVKNIYNALEIRGAAVCKPDDITRQTTALLISHYNLIKYSLIIATLTTALGIVNVLISSHMSRKNEKHVYYVIGMTKKQILAVEVLEVLVALGIALIMVPMLGEIACRLLDMSLVSFGIDFIL